MQSILRGLGRPADSISYEAVRHFARNARNLRVVTYRTLAVSACPCCSFDLASCDLRGSWGRRSSSVLRFCRLLHHAIEAVRAYSA